MGNFDYLFDEETQEAIRLKAMRIRKRVDREDFRSEAMAELWDFMPFDRGEINRTIDRVFGKYEP